VRPADLLVLLAYPWINAQNARIPTVRTVILKEVAELVIMDISLMKILENA